MSDINFNMLTKCSTARPAHRLGGLFDTVTLVTVDEPLARHLASVVFFPEDDGQETDDDEGGEEGGADGGDQAFDEVGRGGNEYATGAAPAASRVPSG